MSVDVRDVLNRRNELSTFVVHLTKDSDETTARENLEVNIGTYTIEARSPMGWAEEQDDSDASRDRASAS